jgi:DnaJ-domain-containing protein 1
MSSRHVEAELAELRAKLELLERSDEDTLEALNDLSEDVRKEISAIYQAIAALSVKISSPSLSGTRKKIGFKTSTSEKE